MGKIKRKPLAKRCEELELERSVSAYVDYMRLSLDNGLPKQVVELFEQIEEHDQIKVIHVLSERAEVLIMKKLLQSRV